MTYLLMCSVLLLYGFLDSAQDKLNSYRYKRPNYPLPWPFIDLWHLIKRVRLYLPVVYLLALWRWPSLLPEYSSDTFGLVTVAVLALCGWLLWHVAIPRPEHWS